MILHREGGGAREGGGGREGGREIEREVGREGGKEGGKEGERGRIGREGRIRVHWYLLVFEHFFRSYAFELAVNHDAYSVAKSFTFCHTEREREEGR